MNDLKAKLETAYKASGGRKVDIISHSMGGLLIKCFISLYSDVSPIAWDLFIYKSPILFNQAILIKRR